MGITKCRGCGADITWVNTDAGKKMPLDVNFTTVYVEYDRGRPATMLKGRQPHWVTCPKADLFKKKKGK